MISVERQSKHFLGYWMTVLGFAAVIVTVFSGVLLQNSTGLMYNLVLVELAVFLIGIELALRNQRHSDHFP